MNPFLLSFADGTTFFVGVATVIVAELLLIRYRTGVFRAVLTVMVLGGMILVIISATPLPAWAYLIWTMFAIAGLILSHRTVSSEKSRVAACIGLFAATAGLCIAEVPHHFSPRLVVSSHATVYVLGDSISAGMATTERCWPTMLSELTSLRVVNLAQPGATVETAIAQARNIADPHSLVVVEIGGNDLLGRQPDAAAFESHLDALVSSIHSRQHQILILELPLFPFQNAFGRAQRRVAHKYDTAILPKRHFTRVLGTKDATRDGIHLSPKGHEAMARIIAAALRVREDAGPGPTG